MPSGRQNLAPAGFPRLALTAGRRRAVGAAHAESAIELSRADGIRPASIRAGSGKYKDTHPSCTRASLWAFMHTQILNIFHFFF